MAYPLINKRHEHFAQLVASGMPAAKAYVEVGYSARGATANASRLMANDSVAERVRLLSGQRAAIVAKELEINVEWVKQQFLDIVQADPNDVVEVIVSACRHCHGARHKWQWRDEAEFEAALQEWTGLSKKKKLLNPMPEALGGYGWSRKLQPHPDCPQCDGFGEPHVLVKATEGHPLFAGIRMTKYGIEFRSHDKLKALNSLCRIVGGFKDDRKAMTNTDKIVEEIRDIMRRSGRGAIFNYARQFGGDA